MTSRPLGFACKWLFLFLLLSYAAWEVSWLEAFFEGYGKLSPLRPIYDEYSNLTFTWRKFHYLYLPYFRTPLTSFYFFGAYLLTGGFHWVPLSFALLFLASLAFFYLSVARYQGSVFAFGLGLALVFYGPHQFIAYRFSEGLGYSLLVVSAAFFWREWMEPRPAHRLGTAVFLSLLVMTRSNFEFLLWFFSLYLGYLYWKTRNQRVTRRALGIMLVILYAPITGWKTYNWARGTHFSSNNLAWASVAALALPNYHFGAHAGPEVPDADIVNQGLRALRRYYRVEAENRICFQLAGRTDCKEEHYYPILLQVTNFPTFIWVVIERASLTGVNQRRDFLESKAHHVRIREAMSRLIVLDVLRRQPRALLKAFWLNFETSAFRPYLVTEEEFNPDRQRVACALAWVAGLVALALLVWGRAGHQSLLALGAMGFFFHLANLIIVAIFGVPYGRYITMTLPFLFFSPLVLGRITWSYLVATLHRLRRPTSTWSSSEPEPVA